MASLNDMLEKFSERAGLYNFDPETHNKFFIEFSSGYMGALESIDEMNFDPVCAEIVAYVETRHWVVL